MSALASPRICIALATLIIGAAPHVLGAQTPQPIAPGQVVQGAVTSARHAAYLFTADGAGVVTAAVRSLDGSDLVLMVTDSDGQPLLDARADQDLGGDAGREQLAATVPRAGSYRIVVEPLGGGAASFELGVSWLPFPSLEQAPDPDGSPGSAVPLTIGQAAHEDVVDGGAGDYWDWYVVRPEAGGTLTVATSSVDGDLVLEAFEDGDFTESAMRSDQDLQGEAGNEAVTLVVTAGRTYHFKVSAFSESARVAYRIQVGLITAGAPG